MSCHSNKWNAFLDQQTILMLRLWGGLWWGLWEGLWEGLRGGLWEGLWGRCFKHCRGGPIHAYSDITKIHLEYSCILLYALICTMVYSNVCRPHRQGEALFCNPTSVEITDQTGDIEASDTGTERPSQCWEEEFHDGSEGFRGVWYVHSVWANPLLHIYV